MLLHFRFMGVWSPTMQTSLDDILRLIKKREKEAYDKGWHDAVVNIVAAARGGALSRIQAPSTPRVGRERLHERSIIDRVFDTIKDRPGMRGADIITRVSDDTGIDYKKVDRTGRTSLMRLRVRGKIVQRDGKWYPAETEAEAETEEEGEKNLGPAVGSLAP